MKNGIIRIILLSVLVKLSYLAFAYLAAPQTGAAHSYLQLIQRNDAAWYKDISEKGYPKIENKRDLGYVDSNNTIQSSWAFFPLYPLINGVLMKIAGVDFGTSAAIWSWVLSTLGFCGLYLFAQSVLTMTGEQSVFVTAGFVLFPFHYYFSMAYTEALFFCLLIFSFLAIAKQQYFALSVLVFLLCLTRPNGVVALLPLFLFHLEQRNLLQGWRMRWNQLLTKQNILSTAAFVAGPLALILYSLYQYQMTGEYFAFSKAQAGWRKTFMFPLLALFREGDWRMQFNSIYTLLAMILAIALRKRLPLSLQVLVWVGLLLPMAAGSVVSMPRYISVLFPLFVVPLGTLYAKFRWAIGLLLVVWLLHLWTFHFWLTGDWFSY